MNLDISNPLETIKKLANEELVGYSAEEIRKIECLYDITVDGEFKSFMELAGKCSGGVIGDEDMLFYREDMNLSDHLLYQEDLRDELREDIGLTDIAKMKPFIFAIEADTQMYLLKTAAEDSQRVYHYNQNHDIFEKTKWSFLDYIGQQILLNARGIRAGYRDNVVCKGDLLRICQNKYV